MNKKIILTRKPKWFLRLLLKFRSGLLMFFGLLAFILAAYVHSHTPMQISRTIEIGVFYLVPLLGAAIVASILPRGIKLHKWFSRRFKSSITIESRDPKCVLDQVLVGVLLNLAFFTIIYAVPLQNVLQIIPLGQIIQNVIPKTFDELMNIPFSWVFFFLFMGSAGPAVIFAIRYQRNSDSETGNTIIRILLVLCYISWVILALFYTGSIASPIKRDNFQVIFWEWVFPGTFANLSFMVFFEQKRQPSYIA